MLSLILTKIGAVLWVFFLAVISFIAVKRLDKPNLSLDEKNRLKFYVILLTGFAAVYGHLQGQKIEQMLETTATAIPGIQTDLKSIGNKVGALPDIREWMAFKLQEESKAKSGKEVLDSGLALVAGSVKQESQNLPVDIAALKAAADKDSSDIRKINLGHAYILARRYTLARQVFESVIQTSSDHWNVEIAGLLARALRAGLGDKLANKELGLAWVLHWDEEPHYNVTAHMSDDRIHWAAVPLEPSNPAGSVIKLPLKQFIQVSASPVPGSSGQPMLYTNTIMLSMGLVDKNYKLFHPLLLTKPQRIPGD